LTYHLGQEHRCPDRNLPVARAALEILHMDRILPWTDQLTSLSRSLGPGLSSALASVELPPLHTVRQTFPRPLIEDVAAAVAEQFRRPEVRERIRPGSRVCIACGSRGIARISSIVKATVAEVRALGAEPFIIPAMGSHGGATPGGQIRVLADYGITEATMGAPIVSSLETQQVGTIADGVPVFCSTDASGADAIIPIGRVKPHTGFRAAIESGLMKMLVIGLGKQHGADTMHGQGMDRFSELLPQAATLILNTQPVAFGIAIVENGYDQPARIEAVLPEGWQVREEELLTEARTLMPSLPFDTADVLVIAAIGKNISGSGMDPNICGRFVRSNGPQYEDHPRIQKVVVLDLTPETHGNASGIGLAEVMTLRVLQKIDLPSTYANCITASHAEGGMLPLVMESDRAALAAALKLCVRLQPGALKIAIIRNTLDVEELWVSPALAEEVRQRDSVEVSATAAPVQFDGDGSLIAPIACSNK
jgi:hypothetical protein